MTVTQETVTNGALESLKQVRFKAFNSDYGALGSIYTIVNLEALAPPPLIKAAHAVNYFALFLGKNN